MRRSEHGEVNRSNRSSPDNFKLTLIAKLWPDVLAQSFIWLCKVVLEQIEEDGIVVLGDSRVFDDEGAILDESVGGSRSRRSHVVSASIKLAGWTPIFTTTHLLASAARASGSPWRKTSRSTIGSVDMLGGCVTMRYGSRTGADQFSVNRLTAFVRRKHLIQFIHASTCSFDCTHGGVADVLVSSLYTAWGV